MSASAERRPWVGGNWKLNHGGSSTGGTAMVSEAAALATGVAERVGAEPGADVVVAPPSLFVAGVAAALAQGEKKTSAVAVAAQNCSQEANGAFTGELSAAMVGAVGATWVIIGHSERRSIFGEQDKDVTAKVTAALDAGLSVCACIGETLEQREAGVTKEVVHIQLAAVIAGVKASKAGEASWAKTVVAYEPVWAIGTGKVASPEQAQEVHAWLRAYLSANASDAVGAATRIVYGGSVKPGNAADLAKQNDIDGFLVGGASLIADDFAAIVKAIAA